MEEKDNATEKMSYEQLENTAMQLQQRLILAENKLRSIDYVSMRLGWLFKTVEYKNAFPAEFVSKCSKEIQELLTVDENPEDRMD